jgi:hypothetical protein
MSPIMIVSIAALKSSWNSARPEIVADKLTPLILTALSRAASAPEGTPLFGSKSQPGLFANTSTAKAAAQKGLAEELLAEANPSGGYTITKKGLDFLIAQSSPRQVLEDLCRVLEARETDVKQLRDMAQRMMTQLSGLKTTLDAVLPQVMSDCTTAASHVTRRFHHDSFQATHNNGDETMTATLISNPLVSEADSAVDLSEAIVAHLSDWSSSAAAGQDCPLPELFRSLSLREPPPSIGTFHDRLRELQAAGRIYLHPWTGPLYALPEPSYALLCGHNIAYYASLC